MVASAEQKSLPKCYISNGPRYYGPMYSAPTNSVEYSQIDKLDFGRIGLAQTRGLYCHMDKLSLKTIRTEFETARGSDCTVRFRDIFGVEHMIDYSDKNKQYRDPITIWVPVEPHENGGKSEWIWYDECGKKR